LIKTTAEIGSIIFITMSISKRKSSRKKFKIRKIIKLTIKKRIANFVREMGGSFSGPE